MGEIEKRWERTKPRDGERQEKEKGERGGREDDDRGSGVGLLGLKVREGLLLDVLDRVRVAVCLFELQKLLKDVFHLLGGEIEGRRAFKDRAHERDVVSVCHLHVDVNVPEIVSLWIVAQDSLHQRSADLHVVVLILHRGKL